jgi:hypothetical protein
MLLYLALVLGLTWPLVLHFTTEVPGHPSLSVKSHLWQFWWTKEALFRPDWFLCWTPLQFYPTGSDILREMGNFFLPVLSVPFQLLFGLAGGYNATLLLMLAATGLAAYALARRFGIGRQGSLICGALYLCLPYVWIEVFNGAAEIAVLFWIPVSLGQLDRCLRQPTCARGLVLGGCLFLAAMSSWYYGLFMCLAAVLGIGGRGLYLIWRRRWRQAGGWDLFCCALLAGVTVLLLIAPAIMEMHEAERIAQIDWKYWSIDPDLGMKTNPDIREFFGPWQRPQFEEQGPITNDTWICYPFAIFPGYPALILGAIGLSRCRRIPAYAMGLAFFFWLLSLGPWLKIAGNWHWCYFPIPLPAFFLASIWEGFAAMVLHSYRAIVVSSLCLALLAGVGWERLMRALTWPQVCYRLLLAVALLLIAVQAVDGAHLDFPLRRSRAVVSPLFHRLAALPDKGAVLDVPIGKENQTVGPSLLAQTVHQRPILAGISFCRRMFAPPDALLSAIFQAQSTNPPPAYVRADADRNGHLYRAGVRFMVVRWDLLPPAQLPRVEAVLERYGTRLDEDPSAQVSL